jgi:DNA repair exonuclease SbcCD ATPase subunit
MDAKSVPVLTVAWWKKNKDLTSSGETMTKALQNFENAKANCDKEPSRDGYMRLIETLDLITDAAKVQAGKLNSTLRGGMIAGLKNYGPVVKKTLDEIQKKNKAYLTRLAELLEEYQKLDKQLDDTISSNMMERGKAVQLMNSFDKACTRGKGRKVKADMERQLETMKSEWQTARQLEQKHNELLRLDQGFAKTDRQSVVGVISFQMHEKREKLEKACLKDIEALRKTINSKSDQELDRGGPEYQKKVKEYVTAMGRIVDKAESTAVEVGKTVIAANKLTVETKDLEKKSQEFGRLCEQHMKAAEELLQEARSLLPAARELDNEDTVEIDKRQRLLVPAYKKIEQACQDVRERIQDLIKTQREQVKQKEQEEQHYELVLKSFNQVVGELKEQTNAWAQKLPSQVEEADRHIKAFNDKKGFNKSQASGVYNILDSIYQSSLGVRRQLDTQVKKITDLHKDDQKAQTRKLTKLVKSIDETSEGCISRMRVLANAIA